MQIPERIAAFQAVLEEYEVKSALQDMLQEVKYILLHYGPRKAAGFLRFGTGNPALTGQLTGILYLLLPAKAGQMEIEPEFNEAVLQTDFTAEGHIRICHVIPAAWRLLRNRRVMRLIKNRKKFQL